MIDGGSNSTWDGVSRAFHWGLAVTIFGMIGFGWWMNHVPARPDRYFYRSIHADIGYALLLLMMARLVWRLLHPAPALPSDTPHWQRLAARVSHAALYGLTMLVALLGWAHSGAHQPDFSDWFGLFRVPQFTSPDKAAAKLYEDWHIFAAYVLSATIAFHVAAAFYHHFVKRDDVTKRMVRDLKPSVTS